MSFRPSLVDLSHTNWCVGGCWHVFNVYSRWFMFSDGPCGSERLIPTAPTCQTVSQWTPSSPSQRKHNLAAPTGLLPPPTPQPSTPTRFCEWPWVPGGGGTVSTRGGALQHGSFWDHPQLTLSHNLQQKVTWRRRLVGEKELEFANVANVSRYDCRLILTSELQRLFNRRTTRLQSLPDVGWCRI